MSDRLIIGWGILTFLYAATMLPELTLGLILMAVAAYIIGFIVEQVYKS